MRNLDEIVEDLHRIVDINRQNGSRGYADTVGVVRQLIDDVKALTADRDAAVERSIKMHRRTQHLESVEVSQAKLVQARDNVVADAHKTSRDRRRRMWSLIKAYREIQKKLESAFHPTDLPRWYVHEYTGTLIDRLIKGRDDAVAQVDRVTRRFDELHRQFSQRDNTICWGVDCVHQADALNWCLRADQERDDALKGQQEALVAIREIQEVLEKRIPHV